MYNYESEFYQAINNTEKLGLTPISFEYKDIKIFDVNDEQKMKNTITSIGKLLEDNITKNLNDDSISEELIRGMVANCTPLHFKMKPFLEELLEQQLYFTTGYIEIFDEKENKSDYYHRMSYSRAKECLEKGIHEPNHHVWLTTQSFEIIDLTFGLTAMMMNPQDFKMVLQHPEYKPWMSMITKHYSDLSSGMMYHPLLISDEFYLRTGMDLKFLSKILYG